MHFTVIAIMVIDDTFKSPLKRTWRCFVFTCLGCSVLIPFLLYYSHHYSSMNSLLFMEYRPCVYILLWHLCFGLGLIHYAWRIPERWWSNTSRSSHLNLGCSHQFLHVYVLIGMCFQYLTFNHYLLY